MSISVKIAGDTMILKQVVQDVGAILGEAAGTPAPKVNGKRPVGGAICVAGTDPEGIRKVWVRKTQNNPGYPTNWNFPKGGQDEGESLSDTARRELSEETGLHGAKLLGGPIYKEDVKDDTISYFFFEHKGPSGGHDKETEKVALVTWPEALDLFKSIKTSSSTVSAAAWSAAVAHIKATYHEDVTQPYTPPAQDSPGKPTTSPLANELTVFQGALSSFRQALATFQDALTGSTDPRAKGFAAICKTLSPILASATKALK